MKNTALISILCIFILTSCEKQNKHDYWMPAQQDLQKLGLLIMDNGIYYKNLNPEAKEDGSKAGLAFYSNGGMYLKSYHFMVDDTLKASDHQDSLILQMDKTSYNFYPVLIGGVKDDGHYSLDNYSFLNKEMPLLPVAIPMDPVTHGARKDTLLLWFKTTDAMKKLLPADLRLEEYLRVPTILNE